MAATVEHLEDRVRDLELSAQRNGDRISSHETLCAERYGNIHRSIGSVNRSIRWATVTLLGGMAAILTKLLFFQSP